MNVELGSFSIDSMNQEQQYLASAKKFMPAIHALSKQGYDCAAGLTLLVAHTLECLLKAHISTGPNKPGKHHDLCHLWAQAHKQGLDVTAVPPNWVTELNKLHSGKFVLRYGSAAHVQVLPNPETLAVEIEKVLSLVTG